LRRPSISAARLQELRGELDATFEVVADNGSAVIVWVVPGDLPPFYMIIDPDNLHPPETAH
jgi:hypothetical protein